MKSMQEKRRDALHRLQGRQERAVAELERLLADRKHMEKTAPKNGAVLIKHGLLAGFSVKDQKNALDSHISMLQADVDRRARELQHLKNMTGQHNAR